MLTCVGIIVLLTIIYSIHGLGCYKRNTGYNVIELENVINNIDNLPTNKIELELL